MTTAEDLDNNGSHTLILGAAALFESEFSIDWLQELTQARPQIILEVLDQGIKRNWLKSENPGYYIFTNIREKSRLKKSLPPDQLESLLQSLTTILLDQEPEDPEKNRILARALLSVKNDLRGCKRLLIEGNLLQDQYRLSEALQFYKKAIEDLDYWEGEEADLLLLESTTEFAKLAIFESDSSLGISTIHKALSRAKSSSTIPYQAQLNMHLAKFYWIFSDVGSAIQYFEKSLALAAEVQDTKYERDFDLVFAFFIFWLGRFNDLLIKYDKYVPEIDDIEQSGLTLLTRILPGEGLVYNGQISRGLGMLRQTIKISQDKKYNFVTAYAQYTMGAILLEIGQTKEAISHLKSALEKTKNGQHLLIRIGTLLLLAYNYCIDGQNDEAMKSFQEFRKLSSQVNIHLNHDPRLLDLCWLMEQGKFPFVEGLSLEAEIDKSLESQNVYIKGMAYRYRALRKKEQGLSGNEVVRDFTSAIEFLDLSGHKIGLSKVELELAREYLEMGDENRAQDISRGAIQFLTTVNQNLIPKEILALNRDIRSAQELLGDIIQLGQELVTIRDNRELVGRIISTACRLAGSERGAIFILDTESEALTLRASKNLTGNDATSPGFAESMKIIKETADSGEGRIFIFNTALENKIPDEDFVRSCVCVPMILRHDSCGVLYLDNVFNDDRFEEADLEILKYFAAQASIAMDNAQAYQALEEILEKQTEQKRYYQEQYLEDMRFENIVGKSPAIQRVFHHIESVASTDATVLILGETGVGKELVARAIHRNSQRKDSPFIRVNCSVYTDNLISSELFGHEKGAFTGAVKRLIGRFELADGGTLFLDEIGDIPPEVQVRLLRVLQSKEFERVGGSETLQSDFRLLAATNRNLEYEVQAGHFRQDLFFRLNVFPIQVPPLRDRKEDIPLLAFHFLNVISKKFGRSIETISKGDLDRLMDYDWPGNIRELENIIERGVILSSGSDLQIPESVLTQPEETVDSGMMTHEENERLHILRILEKNGGKLSGPGGAAEILDMHPNTLRYRLKKLGIQKIRNSFTYG